MLKIDIVLNLVCFLLFFAFLNAEEENCEKFQNLKSSPMKCETTESDIENVLRLVDWSKLFPTMHLLWRPLVSTSFESTNEEHLSSPPVKAFNLSPFTWISMAKGKYLAANCVTAFVFTHERRTLHKVWHEVKNLSLSSPFFKVCLLLFSIAVVQSKKSWEHKRSLMCNNLYCKYNFWVYSLFAPSGIHECTLVMY